MSEDRAAARAEALKAIAAHQATEHVEKMKRKRPPKQEDAKGK